MRTNTAAGRRGYLNEQITFRRKCMSTYLIEREVPGAGKLLPEELREMSAASREVLAELGPQIQWISSYVTENKIYCVYISPGEQLIREHATICGIPVGRILEIKAQISPATAE
jgi:hypothetical protein